MMDADFGGIVRELAAFGHVVPEKHRAAATEVAALVLLSGRAIDPDAPEELIDAVPARVKSTAYMVVSSLRRLRPTARADVFDWARVLLIFRSGKPEDWELELERRGRSRRRRR